MCIWICSGESQVIISLNLDCDIRFGFLGLSFLFLFFFFFFFVDKRLGLFYKGLRFTFLFLDVRIGFQTHRTIFLKEPLRVSF